MEMECLRTQATVSAMHDGEHVTDENAEAARAHIAECGPCRSFEADLDRLADLSGPAAPDGLVDRVMVAVAAIAAERVADEQVSAVAEMPAILKEEPASPRFTWFTERTRLGVYGAMAVAASVLVLVAMLSLRGPGTPPATESSTATNSAGSADLTFSGKTATAPVTAAPAPTPAPASAPDYVTFKERVYAPSALLADSTVATPSLGTVSTAFASAASPSQVPAYRSPVADGSIVIKGPDGARVYVPVFRMFNSTKYQMVAGNAVDRFGTWPELPSRFPAPSSPNGSPTFTAAGSDALGVRIYTARDVPQAQGFAIAPGTPGTDPAASNPNWTWWEPLQMP